MMALQSGRSKFDRINDLIGWGFNAPAYRSVPDGIQAKELHVFNTALFEGWDTVSIRFEGGIHSNVPSIMNKSLNWLVDNTKAVKAIRSIPFRFAQGLEVANISGSIIRLASGEFVLEASWDVPVREITHSKVLPDIRVAGYNLQSDSWRYHPDPLIVEVIDNLRFGPAEDLCFEFSIFNRPVGIKKERVLFWEYEVINGFKDSGDLYRISNARTPRRYFGPDIQKAK
jgi:hypothetical protein